MNYFKRIEKHMVWDRVSKGQYTGLPSRLLSNINLLLMIALASLFIRYALYLPVIFLGLSFIFGNLGTFIFIGLGIYCFVIKFWLGLGVILALIFVGILSMMLGYKHSREIMYSGRLTKNLDPSTGMFDLLPLLIFQLVSIAVALLTSKIISVLAFIIFFLVTAYMALRFWTRYGSAWRKIHYPFLIQYSSVAGYMAGLAQRQKKEFSVEETLKELVKQIIPDWSENEIIQFLTGIKRKIETFSERQIFEDIFKERISDPDKVKELVDKFGDRLRNQENKGMFVRYSIAELLERDYGKEEKKKYFKALLTGIAD